jgi:sigma-B regulation protein RsbU (phosphoserine phosphatase)
MNADTETITELRILNEIAQTLNQVVDVKSALDGTLTRLVELMGLETGWIFLHDETAVEPWWGKNFTLAAHTNLPPSLSLDNPDAWYSGCDCQGLCNAGKLDKAYNEVRCSRLSEAGGDSRGLQVHASAPLRAGDRVWGIVNVAGTEWAEFSPRALELLSNVGAQLGAALQRASYFDLLRERRAHEQAALLDLSKQLLGRLDLDDLMGFLVERVKSLLAVDAAALLLPELSALQYTFGAAAGWHSDPVASERRIPAENLGSPGQPYPAGLDSLVSVATQRAALPGWLKDWQPSEEFESAAILPLLVNERILGALVVSSRQRRHFYEDDLRFLQLMANQAAIAMEKARLRQDEIARQRLEEEIALGREIQLGLLPKASPTPEGWQFDEIYQAARIVGGDFYDFFSLTEDGRQMGLVIGDVSDKGVPAALFMGVSRSLIRGAAVSGLQPAKALEVANRLILEESGTDFFLSAFYGILDLDGGRLTYANAGHNPPLWYRAHSGHIEALQAAGIVLAVVDDISLEEKSVEISQGDVLAFYTDGVTETMNVDLQEFGAERLKTIIRATAHQDARFILWAIVDAVNEFSKGAEQSDDFTLYVVKRL